MMYIAVLIALLLLIAYVTWRWLARELRDAYAALRVAVRQHRGGRSPARLVEETQSAFRARGLEPDFIVVSHESLDLYDALRAQVIDRETRPDLPAAMVIVLGIDVDARTVFLRAVDTPAARPGRETAVFHDCEAVASVRRCEHEGPAGLVAAGDEALELVVAGADPERYRLAVEPAWHVPAGDLASRIHQMVFEQARPRVGPVIVR